MKPSIPLIALPPKNPAPSVATGGPGTGSVAPLAAPIPQMPIGAVQSSPSVSVATGTRQWQRLTLPLANGGVQSIPIPGDTLVVELMRTPFQGGASAEYAATAQADNGPEYPIYEGMRLKFATPYNTLQIRNLNGNEAYFVVWVGFGDFAHPIISAPRSYEFSANGAAIANAVHAAGNIVTVATIDPPPAPYTSARLSRLRMEKDTMATASLRAFIFSGTISAAIGSNIPFTLLDADGPQLQGIVDFPSFITGSAGSTLSVCEVSGIAVPISNYYASANFSAFDPLAGDKLNVVVVAVSAYTSTGENCRIRATFLPN